MSLDGEYASDLAVPLFPSTVFPVGLVSISLSLPWSPTAKLETELSPPFVANSNLQSGDSTTRPGPPPWVTLHLREWCVGTTTIVNDEVPRLVRLHVQMSATSHARFVWTHL